MKRQSRDTRPTEGRPLEEAFGDFEAMEPAGGERQARMPAKAATVMTASAGTKSQQGSATRARKTARRTSTRSKRK